MYTPPHPINNLTFVAGELIVCFGKQSKGTFYPDNRNESEVSGPSAAGRSSGAPV